MSADSLKRQIFIADQQLWKLELTDGKALTWLEPERFELAGTPDDELRLPDAQSIRGDQSLTQPFLVRCRMGSGSDYVSPPMRVWEKVRC